LVFVPKRDGSVMDPAIPASRTLCGLGLRISVYLFGNITKSLNQKSREKRSCQRTEDRWRRAEGPSEIIKGISRGKHGAEDRGQRAKGALSLIAIVVIDIDANWQN